jgi:glycosyltransferase involved in cell wall biosynthesis
MSFSVVILSRNAANLVPCVRAVQRCEPDRQGGWIIVVDDGAQAEAERELSGVWWTKGRKPFVFARNANIGIRAASPDDVILLNDDALLQTPGGFSALHARAVENPGFGIIASTCNNVGNRNQWQMNTGLREDPRMVCFVCVLIPRRTIDAVGLLDERYVGYGCDDDDYCFEVRKHGLKLGIFDGCYVDHGSLTSSFRGAAGAGGDFYPNLKLFIEKWGHDNWGKPRAQSQFAALFPQEAASAFIG